jgi:hypothetical protein
MVRRHAGSWAPHLARESGGDASELEARETLPPPFDLEEFARQRMSQDSELVAPPERPTDPAPADPAQWRPQVRALSTVGDAAREIEAIQAACANHLGSLHQVPRLVAPLHELRNLSLNHQAGFVLSHVDGVSTLEVLLDVCAMPRLDALLLVEKLVEYGVIVLDAERIR